MWMLKISKGGRSGSGWGNCAKKEFPATVSPEKQPLYALFSNIAIKEGISKAIPPICLSFPKKRSVSRSPSARQKWRSEEHTSELQSRGQLVCRLLLATQT